MYKIHFSLKAAGLTRASVIEMTAHKKAADKFTINDNTPFTRPFLTVWQVSSNNYLSGRYMIIFKGNQIHI